MQTRVVFNTIVGFSVIEYIQPNDKVFQVKEKLMVTMKKENNPLLEDLENLQINFNGKCLDDNAMIGDYYPWSEGSMMLLFIQKCFSPQASNISEGTIINNPNIGPVKRERCAIM